MIKVCFTGHRPNKLGGYDWNTHKNKDIMIELESIIISIVNKYQNEDIRFICGGALGIDQMAFHICNNLKSKFNRISLELAIPFKQQANAWIDESVKIYELQKSQADIVTYVDTIDKYIIKGYEVDKYYPAKMQKRNEYMVNQSDIVVAVWDGSSGGTGNCVRYAKKINKEIIFLNPNK